MTRANPAEFRDFQSALEAVGCAGPGDDANEPAPRYDDPALQMRHHDQLLSMAVESLTARATVQPDASPDLLARFYADAWSKPQAERPEHEQVAAELNISDTLSADELARLRREFALANHPDRLPHCYREQATRRMTIANTLIDAELERRRQAPRR